MPWLRPVPVRSVISMTWPASAPWLPTPTAFNTVVLMMIATSTTAMIAGTRSQIGMVLRDFHIGIRPISQQRVLGQRSEEHTSELQSLRHLVCRLLLEKKKNYKDIRVS